MSDAIGVATVETLLVGSGVNFAQGDLALSGVFLIRSSKPNGDPLNVIVDTGHVGMRRNILEALVKADLTAEDIDIVALTHLHWDHVQNVDLFPNAEIVVSTVELDSVDVHFARDLVTPSWTKYLLAGARVRALSPGDELCPGVSVVDAAGHTAGSLAFAVEMDDEVHLITGDALPWAEVARLEQSALVFWNVEQSQETIRRLVEMADVIYPGHDRPFRLRDGQVEYDRPFEMTMFGATPDTPGLDYAPPAILETVDLTDGLPVGPRWTRAELERP